MARSSSNPTCMACKVLMRDCKPGCVFVSNFPADRPYMFHYVHSVFGADNVGKLLSELSPAQQRNAVRSLVYEAEIRIRYPIHGSLGYISELLQYRKQLLHNMKTTKMMTSIIIQQKNALMRYHHQCHPHHRGPFRRGTYSRPPSGMQQQQQQQAAASPASELALVPAQSFGNPFHFQ